MGGILWGLVVVLFAFWLAGIALHIGGSLIHLTLLVIGIIVVVNYMLGRGARV